jgi:chromosome partitioning protein
MLFSRKLKKGGAMIVISVANQKGGVAKTTSAHNIAAALARFNDKRTLLIDMDPQGNLTDSTGLDPKKQEKSVFDVLDGADLVSVIQRLEDKLDILPSNGTLAKAEQYFINAVGRENLLKRPLKKLSDPGYDFVIIDCPPSLGLLTLNAFVASNYLLVPVQAEYHALAGLQQLQETLAKIKVADLNHSLDVLGLFVTLYDGRRKLNVGVDEALRPEWGDRLMVTKIRDNVALAEAPSHSQDIFTYKKNSKGSSDYQALTEEVLNVLQRRAAA